MGINWQVGITGKENVHWSYVGIELTDPGVQVGNFIDRTNIVPSTSNEHYYLEFILNLSSNKC